MKAGNPVIPEAQSPQNVIPEATLSLSGIQHVVFSSLSFGLDPRLRGDDATDVKLDSLLLGYCLTSVFGLKGRSSDTIPSHDAHRYQSQGKAWFVHRPLVTEGDC